MTAIFGILQHTPEPLPTHRLKVAAQTLHHHAEHGLEIWQNGKIALGQALTRFWSNSAHSAAPVQDSERGLTLVADARLDNRPELAKQLNISASDLLNIPDARLLLHAYKAWGEDCPKYLLGDFVFSVWDERNQTLFAARDPIGIRWLYYASNPRQFAFASDIAGLLELMDEAPRINIQHLGNYFILNLSAEIDQTFYQNVHKLLPGQCLQLSAEKLKTWSYWNAEDIKPTTLRDPREAAEHLGQLLKQAVACRAETADRLGTHLSGGLDSSALTALAVKINRQAQRPDPFAFSWSPPLEMRPLMENDERVYTQKIAEYLGIPLCYTHVVPETDILHETSDPSVLPLNSVRFEYQVMLNARQQNVRVLLSGWGGDELAFSRGIGYPSGLIRQGRWLALARYLKNQYGWKPHRWINGLYSHGIYPLLSTKWQQRLPYNLKWNPNKSERQFQKARQATLFSLPSPEFFSSTFYNRLTASHTSDRGWIKPGLHNSQRWYLSVLLNRVESWSLWAARLGARHAYPLLDQRIVEFTLSMPEEWIYWQGHTRELAKHAVSEAIPAQMFKGRDKQDRALFAHQKTPEHKQEVREKRLQVLEIHEKSNPPIAEWLNFNYLRAVLIDSGANLPEGSVIAPENFMPRIGIWQVLNLAFLDRRAILPEENEN